MRPTNVTPIPTPIPAWKRWLAKAFFVAVEWLIIVLTAHQLGQLGAPYIHLAGVVVGLYLHWRFKDFIKGWDKDLHKRQSR